MPIDIRRQDIVQLIEVTVRDIVDEAIGIKSLVLETPSGAALPDAEPGAHIDVHVAPGIVRQYSLCNGPAERGACRTYRIAVKREPASRGGSSRIHDEFHVGRIAAISAPRNHFPLRLDAPHSVLLAAGIGITPLFAMAQRLAAEGRSFELHYFARSQAHAAFHRELGRGVLADASHFHFGLEGEPLTDRLKSLLGTRRTGAQLYLCGPAAFMALVRQTAARAWPADSVHFEYFGAPTDPSMQAHERDAAFVVHLARSGRSVIVAAGCTALDALREAGVDVDSSCEQGVCGSCIARVLDGVPDHRDAYLTDDERCRNDAIALCVSRARSDSLTIDL
jgi:vanillate O-demethylase ferredoxin subunit